MIFQTRIVILMFLAVCGFSACSSDGSSERVTRVLGKFIVSSFQDAEPIVVPPGQPYIVISYGGGRTPMSIVSQRDLLVDYLGPGGLEMSLHNGFLARIRGLGLMRTVISLEAGNGFTQKRCPSKLTIAHG